jgi:hypothetical protein
VSDLPRLTPIFDQQRIGRLRVADFRRARPGVGERDHDVHTSPDPKRATAP